MIAVKQTQRKRPRFIVKSGTAVWRDIGGYDLVLGSANPEEHKALLRPAHNAVASIDRMLGQNQSLETPEPGEIRQPGQAFVNPHADSHGNTKRHPIF